MTNENEQFIQHMDNIIRNTHASRIPQTGTDHNDMDIVQILATADFSVESRIRQSLRRKLIIKGNNMTSLISRKPLLRLTLISLALTLFAISPLGTAFAQSIVNIVQTWQFGEGTSAVSVEGDFIANPSENGEVVIQPAPEGILEEPAIEDLAGEESFTSDTNLPFEDAAGMVSFRLFQPTYIPEGYEFQGVTVINAEKAQMDYLKFEDIGLIGLEQTVVGGINGDVQVTFTSDMTTVEVQVNGQYGLWISTTDGFGMLMWEADGINYQIQLMGVGDLELALRIAESLQ